MASVRMYLMRCDRCGYVEEETESTTGAQSRRLAKELEWSHPRANPAVSQMRIDVCPGCSGGDL